MTAPCAVFEFRRYLLQPGRRDELVRLFDAEFIETQEAVGIHVLGQFFVDDIPDEFAWFRGFANMEARRQALSDFYLTGQAWKTHGHAANATMIDSDNVLLLEEVDGIKPICVRSALGDRDGDAPSGHYEIRVHHVREPDAAVDAWLSSGVPELRDAGAELVGAFRTHHAENTFPRLPVREDVETLVVLTRDGSGAALHAAQEPLRPASNDGPQPFAAFETQPPEILRLTPTSRSALR